MECRSARWVAGVAFVALAACSRSHNDAPAAPAPVVRESKHETPLSTRISRAAPERLVAIGNLHGDLGAARRALRLAGAIDAEDRWIGGKLVIVQTGDEIDREDGDRAILDLFERLKPAAKSAGGEVIALVGNHEIMNTTLDFRYVTPRSFSAFSDVGPSGRMASVLDQVDPNARGRAAAFLPTGPYAKMLSDRPLFVRVGDTFFVHGGLLSKHVSYGLDKMNDEVRGWLLGTARRMPSIVEEEDSPVWLRLYSTKPSSKDCASLAGTLASIQATRIVMGHTVQEDGINAVCDDRAWRIDTGMSSFYGGKVEVLEIRGVEVKVLRGS